MANNPSAAENYHTPPPKKMNIVKEKSIEEKANEAIKNLRRSRLEKGQDFMVFIDGLPDMQSIHEQPEGTFRVMETVEIRAPLKFIRMATAEEILLLKENSPIYGN